ncbi:TetR/AcrR family transcriptional regulator [Pontibacter chitinilyticus]|uniref:TetR/AcrR family transcriptional regulator n=1 Tax=Pontibacter chitinilyticus TaxID=2674989 RepID=UPI0032192A39
MDKPDVIRGRIIQEASALFFSTGYSHVLMSELAQRLGMSKKTLYLYFASKEELLQVVIKEYQQEIQSEVERLLKDETQAFPDKINQIFGFVATKLYTVSPTFVKDVKKHAPKGWALVQAYKADAAFIRFNTLLNEGVRQGYVRQDVNRPLAVLLYASALESILNPDFTQQVPEDLMQELPLKPASVFDGLLNIIFHGILM